VNLRQTFGGKVCGLQAQPLWPCYGLYQLVRSYSKRKYLMKEIVFDML